VGRKEARPSRLATHVLTLARQESLWSPGDRILVALSGGADSVALLHVLSSIAGAEELELTAAHVNYGLRGDESDGDEAHCRTLCDSLDIPLEVKRAPAPPAGNVQDWARRVRQRWFGDLAEAYTCQHIATGHTANDRAETLVLQWLRGASRRGAANMQPRSARWIRPLLASTRADIESYLNAVGATFRTDSTNNTPRYRRNRVRREVLPLLSDIFDMNAVAGLCASADLYALEADYLENEAARHLHLIEPAPCGLRVPLQPLSSLHQAMTLRVLKRALEHMDVRPRRDMLFQLSELVSAPSGKRLRLNRRVTAERGRDHLWLFVATPTPEAVTIRVPGVTLLPDGSLLVVEPLARPDEFPRGDYAIVAAVPGASPLHLRPARPGDRIRPFGSRGTRLVFDLLSEAGVPRHLRTRSWVLESPVRILWLLGHRPAEETRVLPDSPEIYQFRWDSVGSQAKK